jgi:hypothetical protein
MKPARARPRSSKLSFSWRVRTAELVQLIGRRLGPEQSVSELRSEFHAYNGFSICMVVEVGSSTVEAPWLFIIAEVRASLAAPGGSTGSGKLLPVDAADLAVSIKMPAEAAAEGAMHSFSSCNRHRLASTKDVAAYCRYLKLGEGAVVDANSLLVALVSPYLTVTAVAQPAADVDVALMPELVLECTVSSCV